MDDVSFEKLSIQEVESAIREVEAITLRILSGRAQDDRRRSRKILETGYLAARDLQRAAESLRHYGEAWKEEDSKG